MCCTKEPRSFVAQHPCQPNVPVLLRTDFLIGSFYFRGGHTSMCKNSSSHWWTHCKILSELQMWHPLYTATFMQDEGHNTSLCLCKAFYVQYLEKIVLSVDTFNTRASKSPYLTLCYFWMCGYLKKVPWETDIVYNIERYHPTKRVCYTRGNVA